MNKAILTLIVCALALVPAQAQQVHSHTTQKSEKTKGEVTYSCPMHPDVKAKKKGKCPKCGMDLRPVSAEKETAETDSPEPTAASAETAKMNIPDIELLDQNGRKIHFYTDLVKGHTVAINFIFTTCTTICPPLGATFSRVQKELGDRMGQDVRLISITVDPATDTPERLKAWGAKFHAGDGWTFVTGDKPQVDELLRALGASSARREDHTPTVLIGNDTTGTWTRTYGLAQVSQLVQIINTTSPAKVAVDDASPAHKYFTDVELVDQDGKKMRLYTDVLKGKTVVINAFFTTCTSVCPPMNRNMEQIQQALGERVGKDVFLVSISVDPEVDTPPKLKEYAKKFHAGPGWMFLTGKKENVEQALYKLGQHVEAKDDHTTIMIIGNETTGLWKKALGIASPTELVQIVESVVNDKGATQ
jgi:cytochrome oxidase Cu insertion factor (SCO1/SenC/PrrC family)